MKGPLDGTTPQPRFCERDCGPGRDPVPSPSMSTGILIPGEGVGFEICEKTEHLACHVYPQTPRMGPGSAVAVWGA